MFDRKPFDCTQTVQIKVSKVLITTLKLFLALLQNVWVKIRKSIDLIVVKLSLRSIFYSLLRHPPLFWVKVGGGEGNKK
ncbi:MAG: hypothetical protein D8M57_03425 [Candidatus Scalindua sp. AMX11]|nr:MAG: hypothetical protein D8M57_03425 [Candidatus Scalindua sp. AMX11]